MRYNIFLSFSLGLILAITSQPCTSMEDPKGNKSTTRPKQVTPSDALERAPRLYTKACNMLDTLDKAEAFEEVATLVGIALSVYKPSDDLKFYLVLSQMRAKSYCQEGTLLHNLSVAGQPLKSPTDASLELMRKSISCFSLSHQIYKYIKEQAPKNDPNFESTFRDHESICRDYADSLETFATLCALRVENEKEEIKAISLYVESINAKFLSDATCPTKVAKVGLIHLQLLALHRMMQISLTTAQSFDELCEAEPSGGVYTQLIQNAETTKHLLDFMEEYILKAGIDFSVIDQNKVAETGGSRKKKVSKKKDNKAAVESSPLSGLLKKLPATMDPQAFILLPWSIYCGSLTKASSILTELPCIPLLKESYKTKSIFHKINAVQAYKAKIYQGEFSKIPDLEEAYIFACLDDIVGKPELLKAFYKRLHQDRKEAQRQVMAQRIRESLRLKEAEEAQEKLRLEEKQRLKEEKQPELAKKKAVAPSFDTAYATSEVVSAEKTPPLKVKQKTKGVPNLQGSKSQKIVAPESGSNKEASDEDAKVVTILSPDNFYTFQCLTGGILNRNITLDKVIYLLEKGLQCSISFGKGSHRKATAPNGKAWIIPPAWDGPIPPHYRLQLNYFLQADLEIDPDEVEEKKV